MLSPDIILIISCMVIHEVSVPFVVSKCELLTLHSTITSIYALPIGKASFSLPIFVNILNEGQGKSGCF